MSIKTEVITLTPGVAKRFLASNTNNRKINPLVVNDYVGIIESGEWKLNGEAIVFSETGVLLNGQQRCIAVMKSGKSIQTLVVYGVKQDAITTYDNGRKRSVGDAFTILNVPNANVVAATIGVYLNLKKGLSVKSTSTGGNRQRLGITSASRYNIYLEHEKLIIKSINVASLCYKEVKFYTTSFMAGVTMYLVLEKGHSFQKVASFWNQIHMIAGYDPVPATTSLRRILLKYLGGRDRISNNHKMAITIKAWNLYVRGLSSKMLKYNDTEQMPEFI